MTFDLGFINQSNKDKYVLRIASSHERCLMLLQSIVTSLQNNFRIDLCFRQRDNRL